MTQPTTHQVRAGESLSLLARRYGTTVAALAQANGIQDVNRIAQGQRLRLPVDGLSLSEQAKATVVAPAPAPRPSLKACKETPTEADMAAMVARLERHGVTKAWLEALCERHEVPVPLALALVWKESKGKVQARSHAGAKGLMQLMPATARALGVKDAFNAKQNVEAGVRYLGGLMARFDRVDLALAAYNAGPTRVAKLGRVPQLKETQAYVEKIPAWMGVADQAWQQLCP